MPDERLILAADIEALERNYAILMSFLAGAQYNQFQITGTLQAFKEALNRISTQIVAIYQLKGQKTKITWEPLLKNIDNALESLQNPRTNAKTAIELALNMSDPKAAEVMDYMAKLKRSLST